MRHNERSGTRTPIWASHYRIVVRSSSGRCITCNAKVCKLHSAVLGREDIRSLDVAMDDTLIMEVDESFQDLRDVDRDEVLRELAESLADVVQRPVLAELENDVEELARLHKALVLDNVGVLWNV